jgi:hypothetical protein
MPYRGCDDRAVRACAIARTTWPLHCQLAQGKSKKALYVFLWSEGVKPFEIYRSMKIQYGDSYLSQGRVYESVVIFPNGRQKVCRWQWGNAGGAKLVKGHAKKLFSRGHPQGCRQVDKCVANQGNYVEKLNTNNFYKYSRKNVIIKFLLFNDLPSYILSRQYAS